MKRGSTTVWGYRHTCGHVDTVAAFKQNTTPQRPIRCPNCRGFSDFLVLWDDPRGLPARRKLGDAAAS